MTITKKTIERLVLFEERLAKPQNDSNGTFINVGGFWAPL